MQSSRLLEIRPSVFPSLFPLHTKNNVCVCTLDSDIKGSRVSYGQRCRASLFPGNQHSGKLRGQGPQPRSLHIARETVWFMVHPSPSSWDSDSRANLLFLVWGLWLPHSPWHVLWSSSQLPTGELEKKKEPASHLLLVFLTAKPSQSPSLTRATQQGLRTVAASQLGEQKSNDSHRTSLSSSALLPSRQALLWEICSLTDSSILPEHFPFLS